MNRNVVTGLGLAFAAYFGWGLLAPLGKILLLDFEPMGLNAVRMTVATLVLLPMVGWENVKEGVRYLQIPVILAIVLLGGGIDFTAFMLAVERLDATYATFGFYTAPLWTAAWARIRLGERVGAWFLPAVGLLLAGGWFALGGTTTWPVGLSAIGMMWAILSAAGWAVYSVGLREHARKLRLRPLMVATFIASSVYFITVAALVEGLPQLTGHSGKTWAWMILYAVVPTIAALWLFNAAMKRAPASLLNIFISVELASAALWSYLLLGDRFTTLQIVGLVVSLVAVSGYLYTRRNASYDTSDQQGANTQ